MPQQHFNVVSPQLAAELLNQMLGGSAGREATIQSCPHSYLPEFSQSELGPNPLSFHGQRALTLATFASCLASFLCSPISPTMPACIEPRLMVPGCKEFVTETSK